MKNQLTPDGLLHFMVTQGGMPSNIESLLKPYLDAWRDDVEALNATAVSYISTKNSLTEAKAKLAELQEKIEDEALENRFND